MQTTVARWNDCDLNGVLTRANQTSTVMVSSMHVLMMRTGMAYLITATLKVVDLQDQTVMAMEP